MSQRSGVGAGKSSHEQKSTDERKTNRKKNTSFAAALSELRNTA
jgi:hypothetical protein